MSETKGRRDFLQILTVATGGTGAVAFAWPLVNSMNPAADVLALATVEVDLSTVEVGQSITVQWQGKPVFIRRRSEREVMQAKNDDEAQLIDPQLDEERVVNSEWLVLIGICTHLGCVPLGQKEGQPRGEYNGWFCPCHGSQFDSSGRIRKGPAPRNLDVPEYRFISDNVIRIG
ncbi:MAG: ubiquinol-cytochrome c reductase iron-sulfur subunit [Pseudomonadota bacterium]